MAAYPSGHRMTGRNTPWTSHHSIAGSNILKNIFLLYSINLFQQLFFGIVLSLDHIGRYRSGIEK